MYCPNCGSENSDSSKFCEHCGTPLKQTTQQQKIKEPIRKPQSGSNTVSKSSTQGEKILKTISITLLALSVLFSLSVFLSKSCYQFDVRNETDADYWGPGEHWVFVEVTSSVCPIHFGGGQTDIVPAEDVAQTIEQLKPTALNAYQKYVDDSFPVCGIIVLLTLGFYIYVRTISKR